MDKKIDFFFFSVFLSFQVLAAGLEQGNPHYRLCLHYRDFPVSAYLADTIIEAVESSKRTILVLSQHFLANEWCRFEFKSALHQVLRDRQKRLVVVFLGDVPQRDLDPDLRLYLKTSTCVFWGEKAFWDKLRYAMPDVKNATPSTGKKSTGSTSTTATSASNNGHVHTHAHHVGGLHHLHHPHPAFHHLHHHHAGMVDSVSTNGTLVSTNGRVSSSSTNCPTYAEHTYATPKFDTGSVHYATATPVPPPMNVHGHVHAHHTMHMHHHHLWQNGGQAAPQQPIGIHQVS